MIVCIPNGRPAQRPHLVFLHARYGDWPLALAAYTPGSRRVDRALSAGRRAGFWQLADGGSYRYEPHYGARTSIALVRIAELRPSSRAPAGRSR